MNASNGITRSARATARLAALTLAAGALSMIGSIAFAQDSSQTTTQSTVTVTAPRIIERNAVGPAGMGATRYTLVSVISFADLNLDTPEGRVALHKRIRATAQRACEEIGTRYPSQIWIDDVDTCVHNAMLTWMPRAHLSATAQ